MTIRVVARIRPQQNGELEKDVILATGNVDGEPLHPSTLVKIPSPKNENEEFSFQFSSVYNQSSTQQSIFDNEVAPTIKHLFNGFDVTIFAYGSTGTGKTHTMRGGKTLAERGVIPRLLSGIYRRGRKIDKDSSGQTSVKITLSYYEIYNDKVFDLFEAPEKRTMAGLPLRDSNGKTVIVGLTERPCETLKDFERLYDQANSNRSTSATKLNAHSSRSHAILRIRLAVTTGDEVRISTASAIDLAGSEDNRRTDNGKERLVESASINKSLFVLAKCVEAISSKQERVPYRESKMTRILSLGQNNGLTVMILNLSPARSYHLDTLSSLNFANRTKKIEFKEIENDPIFKGCTRAVPASIGASMQRQPLRPLTNTLHNESTHTRVASSKQLDKPSKTFFVYADKTQHSNSITRQVRAELSRRSSPLKRSSDVCTSSWAHPSKRKSPSRISRPQPTMSKETIEDMIERKVTDALAARALDQPSAAPVPEISDEVQRRLQELERKIESKDDGREQGLAFLLMAKQHSVRGEHSSALRMYRLAQEFFPDNSKLEMKIERLREKLKVQKDRNERNSEDKEKSLEKPRTQAPNRLVFEKETQIPRDVKCDLDDEYHEAPEPISDGDYETASSFQSQTRPIKPAQTDTPILGFRDDPLNEKHQTPRTRQLLRVVNTRDVTQIRLLRGVGPKKARAIVEALCAIDDDDDPGYREMRSLQQLGRLRGVGAKTVENMRMGLGSAAES